MPRWALGIEYDGSGWHGWQKQRNASTVEGELLKALQDLVPASIQIGCAGRTDRGVHALEQVIHFDSQRTDNIWMGALNANLDPRIRVLWAKEVSQDFHARYSARSRTYIYVIYKSVLKPCHLVNQAYWKPSDLDLSVMHKASQIWLGEHDFKAIKTSECQSLSSIREIKNFTVKSVGPFVVLIVEANAFLHRMVRNLVGTLLEIGAGKLGIQAAEAILNSGSKPVKMAPTAPAHGLYLLKVKYPEKFGFNLQFRYPWFLNSIYQKDD